MSGYPWKNTIKQTFAEADVLRNKILEVDGMQAKVKRYVENGVERFVVKSRKDPKLTVEELKAKNKSKGKQKRAKKENQASS